MRLGRRTCCTRCAREAVPWSWVMTGHDVRQRIEGFFKRKAREVLLPVSVCISLWLSGCLGCSDGLPFLSQPGSEVFSVSPDADARTRPVSDGGKTDGPPVCPPINCPALICTKYASNPNDPCSCPVCLPTPDAGPDIWPVCPATTCAQRAICPGGYQRTPTTPAVVASVLRLLTPGWMRVLRMRVQMQGPFPIAAMAFSKLIWASNVIWAN